VCGICGAFVVDADLDDQALSPERLEAMLEIIRHRGPDDRGAYATDGAALGARRLSIIDVEGGHQPFANENETVWAVQNGEIYNHDALRRELRDRGHSFRSRCDTEVLPHLYEDHGLSFVERLRGMFAVAVWDERRRRGVLVRDRLGVKPLYYAHSRGRLIFGSELKCLLASGELVLAVDPEALELFLTLGYVPAPRTILSGVAKLPPAHRLVVEGGRVVVERYWEYPAVAGPAPRADVREWAPELRERLRDAVRMRLMSDVPLGAMLSGGLDSSLIVALMAEEMDRPVTTFAVGFENAAQNELADARAVAAALGTDHHELELAGRGPSLDEVVWHLDEPVADLSVVGFIALCGLARQSVTVALSGQGADELFAGYRHHLHAAYAARWERVPSLLRAPAAAFARRGPGKLPRLAELVGEPDPATRALLSKRIATEDELALILGRAPRLDTVSALRPLACGASGALAAALSIDAQLSLPDDMLHYFDRASMAHSLEVRVPFLDHPFVEFCASIPSNLKLRGSTTKYVLREAARGLVPVETLTKKKVGFFNGGVDRWLSSSFRDEAEEAALAERVAAQGYLDASGVRTLFERQRICALPRRAQLLLAVTILDSWLRSYAAAESDSVESARRIAV